MIWAQLLVVLLFIYLGARLGGIGIGFMGGMGVVALSLLGLKPGAIPFDVISVIMSVIMAIAAMQVAGGMDFLVKVAEKILRKNPKYITFLAPTVTYFMTVLAGTGHTAFSTLPVIAEVAKDKVFVLHVHFLLRLSLHKLRLQRLQFLLRWYSFLLN